jgi:hypothetical protein
VLVQDRCARGVSTSSVPVLMQLSARAVRRLLRTARAVHCCAASMALQLDGHLGAAWV